MHELTTLPPAPPGPPGGSLMSLRAPRMGVCYNPLLGVASAELHEVPVGVRLRDFVIEANGPVTCWKNGEWVLREYWDEITLPGDVVVWVVFPQGRETVRLLLQIATIVSMFTPWTAWLTPALAAASVAFNLLVPPRQPNVNDETPGSIYSAALAGNAARLDQPIWKNCGHVKITPPFAAIPYSINRPRTDAVNPRLDTEQYGYFLYCVGIGDHEVVRTFIGKTPVSSFQDVTVARYLAPGEQPTFVEANVLTSTEVSELELATDINGNGVYVGGYVACRPRDRVVKIGIDVTAPQGLGHVTSSGSEDLIVAWQVDVREIDDFGVPLGEWVPIGNEQEEFDTNSAQRWSNEYPLSAPIRCEVRVFRTNEKNRDSDARDQINWSAMRAWLEAPAPLNPKAAHYELVIRASKQLSQESQRDFSMLVNGMSPTWDPDTGWTGNVVHRNPAWWTVDLWKDPDWGEGKADHEIDLLGMWRLAQTCDARQDHFDFSFANSMDAASAADLILLTCRARKSSPLGIRTATRDELVTEHHTMFSARNTQPDSIVMLEDPPTPERPDAVILTYQDHKRWDLQEIICWVPGNTGDSNGDPINPLFVHLEGVIGATHAEREGLAMAFKIAFRGIHWKLTTEMEGFMLRHMDTVRVQPDLPEYGITGDVTYFDAATLALELSEPADFSQAPLYITLRRDDGSITDPVEVTAGVNPTTVYLPAMPDFELVVDDGGRERPVFFLGSIDSDELCKIEEIADGGVTSAEDGEEGGAQLFDITMVVDDPRVHGADNHLLPSLGEIQDPIDDGTEIPSEAGNTAALIRLNDHVISNYGLTNFGSGPPSSLDGTGGIAVYHLLQDGRSRWEASTVLSPGVGTPLNGYFASEWITSAPVEPDFSALYEVYVDDFGTQQILIDAGSNISLSGTVKTWLPMTADYEWKLEHLTGPSFYDNYTAPLRVSIRRIGSDVIQATRQISLVMFYNDERLGAGA